MVRKKNSFFDFKAQGTIEYLIIVAVVIVLSLIVVALVLSSSNNSTAQLIDSSAQMSNVFGGSISASELVIDPNGNALFKLNNLSGDNVTIKKIIVGGEESAYNDLVPSTGERMIFLADSNTNCVCQENQKNAVCVVEIVYVTREGLEKKETRNLTIDCVNTAAPSQPLQVSGLGSGTIDDPFVINSCKELQRMKDNLDWHYALGGDINCNWTKTVNLETIEAYCTYDDEWTTYNESDCKNYYGDDAWNEEETYYSGFEPIGIGFNGTCENAKEGSEETCNINKDTCLSDTCRQDYCTNCYGGDDPNCEWNGMMCNYAEEYCVDESECGGGEWNMGESPVWHPSTNSFAGTFDGRNHTISDLYINKPSTNYVGLFGYSADEAIIKNVGIIDANITGSSYVGGIVGKNKGTISGIYNLNGKITGTGNNVGGLIGENNSTTLFSGIYNTGIVTGVDYIGGLIGLNDYRSNIEYSYNTGAVIGHDYVGGLTSSTFGLIYRSYNRGNITGRWYVGGLAGTSQFGKLVRESYNTGEVYGTYDVGGLIGRSSGGIFDSYNTGKLSGSTLGGVIGYVWYSSFSNCYNTGLIEGTGGGLAYTGMGGSASSTSYWDINTSTKQSSAYGGTGKTTVNMFKQETYVGWDFNTIWIIDEDTSYPILRWQN